MKTVGMKIHVFPVELQVRLNSLNGKWEPAAAVNHRDQERLYTIKNLATGIGLYSSSWKCG